VVAGRDPAGRRGRRVGGRGDEDGMRAGGGRGGEEGKAKPMETEGERDGEKEASNRW
jgi:hypothetical protein